MADEQETTSDPWPALRSLPHAIDPPSQAETRIVSALRREGLLEPSRRSRRRPWLALAAGLLLFAAGWAAGARGLQPGAPPAAEPAFALLLYGDVSTAGGADEAVLFEEYRQWAISLRDAGRAVSGQRLGDATRVVQTSPGVTPTRVRGFFLISAASIDEAETIARTCPHAQRGGAIVVQPIG